MTDYAKLLREALSQGYSLEPALAALRERGASPIESIKAVREVTGMSLVEAKKVLSASQAWGDIRESVDPSEAANFGGAKPMPIPGTEGSK